MWQSYPNLLVQSAVFGLLVILLSLGAVEVLADGRVVMVLGDWEVVYISSVNVSQLEGNIRVRVLDYEHKLPVSDFEAQLISERRIVNNQAITWVYFNVPTANRWLPVRFSSFDYRQFRIAVTQEQKALIEHASKGRLIVLIAP